MNIKLIRMHLYTRTLIEELSFSPDVTFIYGPVGRGKSTVARLIDYCFGGSLERTPAIQSEFVSVTLEAELGKSHCIFERSSVDTQSVRVTWEDETGSQQTANAPIGAGDFPIVGDNVFNLSDLIFHLCGVEPVKVPKSRIDPDSPLIRLSFRDIWRFCYLDQAHLDSSFFRLDDPIRGRKSQDALRFFTGLSSEALSILEAEIYKKRAEQRTLNDTIRQIEEFLSRFQLGSEMEIKAQIREAEDHLRESNESLRGLEQERFVSIHPTDELREALRRHSGYIGSITESYEVAKATVSEQESLYAELMTAKIKATRASEAGTVLSGVEFSCCPRCGSDISDRQDSEMECRLCGSDTNNTERSPHTDFEALRVELNERLDQLADSISRRKQSIQRTERELGIARERKEALDRQLQEELRQYDSAYIETVREFERNIATYQERIRFLNQLAEMPLQIDHLHEEIDSTISQIALLEEKILKERERLGHADIVVNDIASSFKEVMLNVGLPGVEDDDEVVLDPKNWKPLIVHGDQVWGFFDTGSGGKKTLFNVCFAIALQEVARRRGLPLPNLLIVDSPTKNISEHMNPELVSALYDEIFEFSERRIGDGIQLLLIDSDIVEPRDKGFDFVARRMEGTDEFPSLFSNYNGP